ncbi:MAG: hypothetical protein V3V19_11105 [Cocleimonas sp.]
MNSESHLTKDNQRKDCKLHGFAQYDDGSFHLEVELPYEIIVEKTQTKFLRLFFDKSSKEFIQMMGIEL